MKIIEKIKIEGKITALTGFRIGGNKTSLEIGGVDNNIIKTGNGLPYIPGSSLRGKMRSLLARIEGSVKIESDSEKIKQLFGYEGGADKNSKETITRLRVFDALLDEKAFTEKFGEKNERMLDFEYSEIKTENMIKRSSGTADNPRIVERVPAGAVFTFEMLLDVYDNDDRDKFLQMINSAMQLLELDYLGGHGSRGSGRIKIDVTNLSGKKIQADGITNLTSISVKQYFDESLISNA